MVREGVQFGKWPIYLTISHTLRSINKSEYPEMIYPLYRLFTTDMSGSKVGRFLQLNYLETFMHQR